MFLDIDSPPVEVPIDILSYVLGLIGQAISFLRYTVPDFIFHSDNGYIIILIAVFVVGTIINLLTGEDSDIVDDD